MDQQDAVDGNLLYRISLCQAVDSKKMISMKHLLHRFYRKLSVVVGMGIS